MFKIPTVTKNLLIINFLVALISLAIGTDVYGDYKLNDVLGLHFFMASDFQPWQLVTYMFLHANILSNPTHIIFNMFALWMFGQTVERVWGAKKFLFYYISCGIGAGLFQEAAQFASFYITASQMPGFEFALLGKIAEVNNAALNSWTTVGASGSVFGILLAFGMLFPNERMFVFPLPIPIKAKYFVIGYAAIELVQSLATPGDNVAHIAHLGGMLFGFFMIKYWQKHPGKDYDFNSGEKSFEKLKNLFGGKKQKEMNNGAAANKHESDWDYNARKHANQEEIDRILDKIRKSGYDSLSVEEKQKLFDQSNK